MAEASGVDRSQLAQPRRALIIVDMSVEQVANIQYEKKSLVENIKTLAELNFWDLKVDSRLWLHSDKESSLSHIYPKVGVTGYGDRNQKELV